nr:hypothetical protein [Rhodococcus erythropolis]
MYATTPVSVVASQLTYVTRSEAVTAMARVVLAVNCFPVRHDDPQRSERIIRCFIGFEA